jgi:hypothetical protein
MTAWRRQAVVVVHHDVCALGGERRGDGLADPGGRAGHERRLACQRTGPGDGAGHSNQ